MKEILDKINKHLKSIDKRYEVVSYAKTKEKYYFNYMAKVTDPEEFIYSESIGKNYYIPIIDNSMIEYNIKKQEILTVNILSSFDNIEELKFTNIKDTE